MSNSKTLVTPDGAKHTRFSSDDEEVPKGEKPKKRQETIEVHSANSWEKADLGDGERNNKFLKLMGAAKKEHKGRFVIGDSKPHKDEASVKGKDLNEKLENQFKQSMEHRLTGGRGGHIGLGFHDSEAEKSADDEASRSSVDTGAEAKIEEKDDQANDVTETGEQPEDKDRKRSSDTTLDKASDPKKLKFVKSSSND